MRTDAVNFALTNSSGEKSPRFVIEVSFDSDNTDLLYFTSHDGTALPSTASVISSSVVQEIGGTSQRLNPDEARAEIGAIAFKVLDDDNYLTIKIKEKLDSAKGLRGKRVRFYMGFEGLAWSDYSLVQTQIIQEISFTNNLYSIDCTDIQRSARADIFDLTKTTLRTSVGIADSTINVYDTSSFELVYHGTSWTDSPNTATVGYFKLEEEVISYTGKTLDSFTGCVRGVLDTVAASHTTVSGASADRQPKIEEYVYLELPAVKLIYAVLTGTLYGDSQTLPSGWHLGIDTAFITESDFTSIGTDWWDTSDDTAGIVLRFEGLDKTDGKAFIEKELLLLLGSFMPVYADGSLGFKRMTGVLTQSAYSQLLDSTNIVRHSALKHEMKKIRNAITVDWNWNDIKGEFTRTTILLDAISIAQHGQADRYDLEFRGLHGSRHTETLLSSRFDSIRDRYAGPPQRLNVTCLPSHNVIEVGDIVRVNLDSLQDYTRGTSIDRSFEVQSTRVDWVKGTVALNLFGSAQPSAPIAQGTTSVLPDSWYCDGSGNAGAGGGSNINTQLTVVDSGGVNHITASGSLPAGTYFSCKELVIDVGVVVTIVDHVELHVKGFLTINGAVEGIGNNTLAVGTAGTTRWNAGIGTSGFIGSSRGGGGATVRAGSTKLSFYHDHSKSGITTTGQYSSIPVFDILYDGTDLNGLPSHMKGTSGAGGEVLWEDASNGVYAGGIGGKGGSSLTVVCRGAAFGASGYIDVSGADGGSGAGNFFNGINNSASYAYAGGGAGGAPGGVLFVLDGADSTQPDLSVDLLNAYGACPMPGTRFTTPTGYVPSSDTYHSYYECLGSGSLNDAGYRIQYIPPFEQPEGDATLVPSGVTGLTASQLFGGAPVIMNWSANPEGNITGYEIRYALRSSGATWTTSIVLTQLVTGTTYTSVVLPPEAVRLFIKAKNNFGFYSDVATTYDMTVTDDYVAVHTFQQHPNFPGTINVVTPNKLLLSTGDRLLAEASSTFLANERTMDSFVKHNNRLLPNSRSFPDEQGWETFDEFVPDPVASATYDITEFDDDEDEALRWRATMLGDLGPTESAGNFTPHYLLDYKSADVSAVYDGYEEIVTQADVNGRYFKNRLTMIPSEGVAYVSVFTPIAESGPRTESATSVIVSTSAGGGHLITFGATFHISPLVTVAAVGSTAQTVTRNNVTVSSFIAYTFDSDGSSITGLIDWDAIGN